MGLLTDGGGVKKTSPHTYPIMTKRGKVIPYLKEIQKNINHVTHPLTSVDISIFLLEIRKCCYKFQERFFTIVWTPTNMIRRFNRNKRNDKFFHLTGSTITQHRSLYRQYLLQALLLIRFRCCFPLLPFRSFFYYIRVFYGRFGGFR